jgi:hypothetical protein
VGVHDVPLAAPATQSPAPPFGICGYASLQKSLASGFGLHFKSEFVKTPQAQVNDPEVTKSAPQFMVLQVWPWIN